ncbi:MAG: polymerase, sigma-24 subunit, subfamily [Myxococcaceae bacterium]|nr:polymerase, sigma-24 subunit, subfamily [Myxococcaceae bacterium]
MCYDARVDPNAELVKRAIVREPDGVHAFVRNVSPVVYGRIADALLRRSGPAATQEEVEHLAQEVFLALFDNGGRALRAWKPQHAPLGAFVALVADHEIYSIFRGGKRRPWTDDIDILTTPEVASSIEALLDRLRADLSAKGLDLFTRLYVDEQSVAKVSADLGMSADAIDAWRRRLAKAVTLDTQPSAITDDDFAILLQLGARAREQRADGVDRAGAAAVPALGAAAEERIAARLLERVRDSLTHDLAAPRSSKPAVARSSRRWIIPTLAALLLAALAVRLFVVPRGSSAIVAPPAYTMTLVSVNDNRDPASAKVTETDFALDPDGELELMARPTAPVKDVHARAYLVRSGSSNAADVKPWLVPLQVSDDGAVRITGMTRLLFPTTNEPYDIVMFVAAGDVLPSDVDARGVASSAAAPEAAKYRVIRGHVRFVEKKQPSSL